VVDVAAYVAAGATLPGGPPGPPDAPLDNGGLRSQITADFHTAAELRPGNKAKRITRQRKKRRFHAKLVGLLGRMGAGEFGWSGDKLAEKYLDAVKRCPGVVRTHGVCGNDSFAPYRCDMPVCPWCQGRLATRRAERIAPVVEKFERPKLWTFTGGPNQEELTPGGVAALQAAAAALHRRVYIKRRCKGGFRKIEITNNNNGWNIHCHELINADYVPIWPVSDIARPGPPLRPYTVKELHPVPVVHPGLAVLFTEACQKFEDLRADGVRWDGFPVFKSDDPQSWYIVDVREARYSPEREIAKYIAKGNEIVSAGGRAVLDYLDAIKGKQLFKGFGDCYRIEEPEPEEPGPVELTRDCPYEDCPSPADVGWSYKYPGMPDAGLYKMERNPATGTSRVLALGP
jgi:hypothetical protein